MRARPENWREFQADDPALGVVPLFGTVEGFLAGAPKHGPNESNAEKALFLFRDLLRFHLRDKDPPALIHADLERLAWAEKVTVGASKRRRYEAASEKLVERWSSQDIASEAAFLRAELEGRDGEHPVHVCPPGSTAIRKAR